VLGEDGDDEVVVVALGKAGEDDGADDGVGIGGEADGKATAVGGEVGLGELEDVEAGIVADEFAADGVGAAAKVMHGIALAPNPVGLAGFGAGGGAGEEDLAVELDLDGAAGVALEKAVAEQAADLPCGEGVEGRKEEEGFLRGEGVEVSEREVVHRGVLGRVHKRTFWLRVTEWSICSRLEDVSSF
jgi:hypothetical protein